MPGVIRAPLSLGTLPYSLSTKFSESRSVQMRINEYHDGSCQRVSLVTGSRRTWKLSKRLDPFHLGLLRAFCATVQSGAFYFYNPIETLPAFSNNPVGTSGQYLVRFNSDWSQINGMGRSDCELEIVEVSATGAIDIGAPIELN